MMRRRLASAASLACAAAWVWLAPSVLAGQGRGIAVAPRADDPANAGADLSPKPALAASTPDEQARRFWLPAGYRITPVLADPDIENPGQIAFDGNGRMFVTELRGYEQTRDGRDILHPVGRISVHDDRDGDGVYEYHRVFVDRLLFPRYVLPFGTDSILTLENDGDEILRFTDTNGDGVADQKVVFATSAGRGGALGGQPSGLVWALDNWLYSTVNAFRLRWTPAGVRREPTGANGAQWGATQDDDGRMWFQAGASGLPGYFQFPVHYGLFNAPGQIDPALNVTWGAPILVGDISGGLPATRMPDGSLMYVTAGAGNDVFRGDRLPADLRGDYVYGEIVARIVRRLRPLRREGLTRLENAYDRSEFIKSVDPYFRPVDMATAPDGTLYIVDMYRGVVEWAQGARVGTYLRQKIDQYQMDRVSAHGRIFRVTYDGLPRDRRAPRMLRETPALLVAHLSHPNGWWRDTAQQLLVLKQDRSVVPALEAIARTPRADPRAPGASDLARIHALWTLEGLGALDASLVRVLLRDPSPRLRRHAIRASETLYKAGDRSFAADYRAAADDADPDVAVQGLLTMNVVNAPGTDAALDQADAGGRPAGVRFVASSMRAAASALGAARAIGASADEQASYARGQAIYRELCFACHGDDGRGAPQPGAGGTLAPSLAGSPRVSGHRAYIVSVLLHGLTGPVDGREYSEPMVPMGSNPDAWIADVASYVRNSFGNAGTFVSAADVARARAAMRRAAPWTTAELEAAMPVVLVADDRWTVTASHAAATAAAALGLSGWSSAAPQQAGMWLQVELPDVTPITEVHFTSPVQGGGRNGPPPAETYPRAWRLDISTDGVTWGTPVAEGRGAGRSTVIAFAPVRGRFVRISLTAGDQAPAWTVQRLKIYRSH